MHQCQVEEILQVYVCLVTGCQLGLPYCHPCLCSKNFGPVLVHPHWTILLPLSEQR